MDKERNAIWSKMLTEQLDRRGWLIQSMYLEIGKRFRGEKSLLQNTDQTIDMCKMIIEADRQIKSIRLNMQKEED